MKIGLDFDGVISDCGRLKAETALEMYGVRILPSQSKKQIVVGGGLLTGEQYHKLQRSIYGAREYGLRMVPVDGALRSVDALTKAGHIVVVITSRGATEYDVAREWCGHHGFVLDMVGVGQGKTKAEAANGLDAYVDDDLDKLVPLANVVPRLFLFTWGYNDADRLPVGVERVGRWDELLDVMLSFS